MEWSARPGIPAASAAAALVLAAAAVLVEPVGRVLLGTAAVLLLVLALRSAVLRPRLAADATGVVVRRLTGSVRLPWPGLRVQVRETRRWGLRSRLLELDTAAGPDDVGDLVLLGAWELGADLDAVALALEAWRPV